MMIISNLMYILILLGYTTVAYLTAMFMIGATYKPSRSLKIKLCVMALMWPMAVVFLMFSK